MQGFESFLDTLAGGMGAVVISGEEGIGKTTVWANAVAEARGRGYEILAHAGAESERSIPFVAIGGLLDGLLETARAELPARHVDALDAAIAGDEAGRCRAHQKLVCLAVFELLRCRLRHAPVLVAIDDAQWLDRPSSLALEFAARRLTAEPLVVVCTVIGDDPPIPLNLDRALSPERIRRLPVSGLEIHQIDALLRARSGIALPRPTLLRLHRAVGGNPLLALEAAPGLADGDRRVTDPIPVPDSVIRRMRGGLRGLSADARETLLVAAALRIPTVRALMAALGERASAGLAEALDTRVVEVRGEDVVFAHPILPSVLYHGASPGRRRVLHRHLAAVVADPAEAARHLALGSVGTDESVASKVEDAATTALDRGDQSTAAELGELAAVCTPPARRAEARDRWIRAAEAQVRAGDVARARRVLERVVSADPGPPPSLGALRRLAAVRYHQEGWTAAVDLLLAAVGEADGCERGEARRDLAWLEATRGRLERAVSCARLAADDATRTARPPLLAEASAVAAWALGLQGEEARFDVSEQDLDEGWPEGLGVLPPLAIVRGAMLTWFDRFEEARSLFVRAHHRATGRGEVHHLPSLLSHRAELECWAGNWRLAQACAEESCRMAEQTGQIVALCDALTAFALVQAHLGAAEPARESAGRALEIAEALGGELAAMQASAVLGFLALSLGDHEVACLHLSRAWRLASEIGLEEPGVLRYAPDLVEALIGLGRLCEAAPIVERWEALGRRLGRPSVAPVAGRLRGLLAAAEGDAEAAVEALDRSVEMHERSPVPFDLARTLLLAGEACRRLKQKREARARLSRALELFEGLGAACWAGRARAEIARIGGRVGGFDLTATEERVAVLVAEGRTNREVAGILFLSPKTVAGYLSNIYRKTGVRSRTELSRRISVADGQRDEDRPRPILSLARPSETGRIFGKPGAREQYGARGEARASGEPGASAQSPAGGQPGASRPSRAIGRGPLAALP